MTELTDKSLMLNVVDTVTTETLLQWRGDGAVFAKLPDGRYVEVVEKHADKPHCVTCQCNKLHPAPPVPGNPMSKSWHENTEKKA